MQTTSTTTKVVEKRTTTTSSQPQKPATQVVDKRSHQTTTVTTSSHTVTQSKPGTQVQVVQNRSQKPGTTVKTTTTTTTTKVSTNKPTTQIQVSNKRSQNGTTVKSSVSPGRTNAQPKVVDNRAHKTVPVKVTTTSQVKVVEKKSQNQNQKTTSKPTTNTGSRPQSKPASQAPTKKVEIKQTAYSVIADEDKIKEAFELFDSNDGRLDAGEVKDAMQNIGYDEKNPVIFQVVTELDNPRNKNSGGATFDDFCQTINFRIPEKETDEELRKIFELFVDPDSDTTSLESIKRVADEIGANIEEAELQAMLNKASKSGSQLTFEDFVAIMKEKI